MIKVKNGKITVYGEIGELLIDIAVIESSIENIKKDIANDIDEPLESVEHDINVFKEEYKKHAPEKRMQHVIESDDFVITAKGEEDESEN